MVGTLLLLLLSSSSHVTTSRLLCVRAHLAYWARCDAAQWSPTAMVPSCMSSARFGLMKLTVGSFLKFRGKLEKSRPSPDSLGKVAQGLCFRTAVDSLKPLKLSE